MESSKSIQNGASAVVKDYQPNTSGSLKTIFGNKPITCIEIGKTESHYHSKLISEGIAISEIHLLNITENSKSEELEFSRYGYYSSRGYKNLGNAENIQEYAIYPDNTPLRSLKFLNESVADGCIDLLYFHEELKTDQLSRILSILSSDIEIYTIGLNAPLFSSFQLAKSLESNFAVLSLSEKNKYDDMTSKLTTILVNKSLHAKRSEVFFEKLLEDNAKDERIRQLEHEIDSYKKQLSLNHEPKNISSNNRENKILQELRAENKDLREENEMVIEQLNIVQSELERYYIKSKESNATF